MYKNLLTIHIKTATLYAWEIFMKTTLALNEVLLAEAMRWTGEKTKTAAINTALEQIIKSKKRERLISFAGKMNLDTDLNITRKRNVYDSR
jgi:Arc/MetJ family transcription regulator